MSIQYCALSWDISEFRILISPSCSLLIHQSGNYCHFDQEFLQNNCLFDLRCLKCYLFCSNAALKWAFNIHDFHPKMPLLVDQKVFLTPFKTSGALPAYCPLIRVTVPLKSWADTVFKRGLCLNRKHWVIQQVIGSFTVSLVKYQCSTRGQKYELMRLYSLYCFPALSAKECNSFLKILCLH